MPSIIYPRLKVKKFSIIKGPLTEHFHLSKINNNHRFRPILQRLLQKFLNAIPPLPQYLRHLHLSFFQHGPSPTPILSSLPLLLLHPTHTTPVIPTSSSLFQIVPPVTVSPAILNHSCIHLRLRTKTVWNSAQIHLQCQLNRLR